MTPAFFMRTAKTLIRLGESYAMDSCNVTKCKKKKKKKKKKKLRECFPQEGIEPESPA